MAAPWFVGDEVTAAGFRLAGAEVVVPESGAEVAAVRAALERCELLFIGAGCAARLPVALLERALAGWRPLVLVVPEVAGTAEVPDIARKLRTQLGLEG